MNEKTGKDNKMSLLTQKICSTAFLLKAIKKEFSKIPDPRDFIQNRVILLVDHLMSGLAIFGLKFPSLLDYDRSRSQLPIEQNLKDLYLIDTPPSDTYLRERLDEVNPSFLRPVFTKLFAFLQRGKHLEQFKFLNGYYLVSIDGTGKISSGKVSCPCCCRKEHSNGKETFYHQMLGACIVHPNLSNVIPLCPEMIQNTDGSTKNDCERNAAKRFLESFRKEHPHLKVIIIEDGLASNAPHIRDLEAYDMKFILGAKPGDHEHLFKQVEESDETVYHEIQDEKGFLHQFHFLNGVSLNKTNPDLKVNFLEYMETSSKGKEIRFSWVTNIPISRDIVYQLMKGGRSRWRIENETYNTLKNLGYNFEHNYGHGKQNLVTVFSLLMMLAFLIDQIQEITNSLYRTAKISAGTYRGLWRKTHSLFEFVVLGSWEMLYKMIGERLVLSLPPDTS